MSITDKDRLSPERVAKLKSLGIECQDGIPILPLTPSSITRIREYTIEAGQLSTEAELQKVIEDMWLEPEGTFYYYYPRGGGSITDKPLLAAQNRGDVLLDRSERHYYKRASTGRRYRSSFVQALPNADGRYAGPGFKREAEYWRVKLELSQRRRDELDAWRKIQLEEHYRQEAKKARYTYDVFLSYAATDEKEATGIHEQLVSAGHRVFMAPKIIRPGDDFAEKIRLALHGSRELWLLVSPESSKSEWVISEWGAAWALAKRIVPILHRCSHDALPQRLARLHCTDLYRVGELVAQLARATAADTSS